MDSTNKKLVYEGTSLQIYFTLKNKLDSAGIEYTSSENRREGLVQLVTQLFAFGRASRGMNDERAAQYLVYVSEENYEKAARILYECR